MKEKKITPHTLYSFLIFAFFAWFILSCLVIPNLNTIWSVFVQDGTFTLEPLQKLLSSERAMKSLRNSFILAPTLALTVGFVGISLVLITEYFDIKGASILRLGYMTTLIYGGIILVSGYKFIYGSNGFLTNLFVKIIPNFPTDWFQGYWAVLFVMTFACTSNHMIFLRNAMRAVDFQTVEAAQNMGASPAKILIQVVLPVLTPSLLAVTILTFITGLSATSAPLIVGGKDFQTITPMILSFSKNMGSRDLAALLALFLGIATILLLTVMMKIEKRGHYMSISKVKTTIVKQKIRNPILNILAHIYAYLLFLIYVVPVVLIILFSFTDAATIASRKLNLSSFTLKNYLTIFKSTSAYKPFLVSIAYSCLAAFAVAVLVLIACRLIQKRKGKLVSAVEYGMLIPWLLPTTLIAMGLITTYNTPHFWMFGKVLTGTSFIMFLGYVIIKIPFTLRMTKAAFFALDDSLEDAAKNLGAKPFYTFFRVVLPVVLPTVLAIFALNFNGLLGDYDMSVFMYHPLNQPLGVYIKSLTDSQSNADNSALTFVYAVLMMIISGIVLYLVYGRGENKVKGNK
ncbi:MAG: iron ABC transporter permease [Lachnospiraceae bacterium]|nr:iron ABC transporter permease [Lachnospiraceae bacterium]